jgi:hypothetical protein
MIRRHKWWLVAVGLLVAVEAWYIITRPRWRQLEGQHHVVDFSSDGRVLATIGGDGMGYHPDRQCIEWREQ